jgi:GT2 family glycosyltransferase
MNSKKFAAFVVTFRRPDVLMDTIKEILSQTRPPDKILVVDNNDNDDTKNNLAKMFPQVAHLKVGYNAGYAGAGKIGLETLAKEGYEWIFWGDDNDPPHMRDTFEKLLQLADSYKGNCGQVGVVGHKLNTRTGILKRTSNEELERSEYVKVDTIGGGMIKIISGKCILNGVVPEAKLFFGFEDLDFDLSQKAAGYDVVVHSGLFLALREKWNRKQVKRVITKKKDEGVLWRDYYSIRNLLFIMRKNKHYAGFLSVLFTSFFKSVWSYKYGFRYGTLVMKNTCKAIRDYSLSRYYKTI